MPRLTLAVVLGLALCLNAVPAQQDTLVSPEFPESFLKRALANGPAHQAAWDRVPERLRGSMAFLLQHMPDQDAQTLSPTFLLEQVRLAHTARDQVPWGAALPEAIFRNDVLPYAQANEPREDWRTGFAERFLPLVKGCTTPGEAALILNSRVFDLLGVHYSTGRARADQAPSASVTQGKASCTGLSIILADACRACCVPARLVSVRWPHRAGNHTWVEVFDGTAWRFLGADEPDPAGLDRGWFVGDAAHCAAASREHRVWAVSFGATGERFQAGWGRNISLWGIDVSPRYAQGVATESPQDAAVSAQIDRWFATPAENRATFEFDRNLDEELRTPEGDARLRRIAGAAWRRAESRAFAADHAANRVRLGDAESPFTVKAVGEKPATGWPLVIAMHGGGGVPKRVNDSQWEHMQVYYKEHPEVGGYLYCALRAPNDTWNGFYADPFYPLLERLIRQFVVCAEVDPDRVIAIGYSHGGYGAFALGPKLPHRFAAVHASAAAPTDGECSPIGLHSLRFSFMVGGRDRAYGRRERCEAFAARLEACRKEHPEHYPTTFTLVEDNGHTGLPDRDLLASLLPHRRVSQPRQLFWEPTDTVVDRHYWLTTPHPAKGQRFSAMRAGPRIEVTRSPRTPVQLHLDARGTGLSQDIELVIDGVTRTLRPAPSLSTLCSSIDSTGDPHLGASWIIPVE